MKRYTSNSGIVLGSGAVLLRRLRLFRAAALLGVCVATVTLATSACARESADLHAGLIDQLSPAFPNESFTSEVAAAVEEFGLSLETYEGDAVDVNLYRSLGERSLGVLVIRSHSGILQLEGEDQQGVTALFTNEPYSEQKYVGEQLRGRLLIVRPFEADPKLTFGVTPNFVRQSMDGYLPRTIVVVAGCSVLGRTDLAEALVSRGASVVISWDRSVGLAHADAATARFVTHLCAEGMTVDEAVVATMVEMGPDPDYGAVLRYYPASVAQRAAAELLQQ
jgi:hypothetical protein